MTTMHQSQNIFSVALKEKKKTVEAFSSTKTSTPEDVSPTPRMNPLINQAGPSW